MNEENRDLWPRLAARDMLDRSMLEIEVTNHAIARIPTSELRNLFTEANILRMQLNDKLREIMRGDT